jgi:hypothetical protein
VFARTRQKVLLHPRRVCSSIASISRLLAYLSIKICSELIIKFYCLTSRRSGPPNLLSNFFYRLIQSFASVILRKNASTVRVHERQILCVRKLQHTLRLRWGFFFFLRICILQSSKRLYAPSFPREPTKPTPTSTIFSGDIASLGFIYIYLLFFLFFFPFC